MGFEKDDAYFFKQMGKAMPCTSTYMLFGVAWLWNETSPLGWWTLKPRPKVRMGLTGPRRVLESLACPVRVCLLGLTGIGGGNSFCTHVLLQSSAVYDRV
jgi:hypothetical protein